ncbi:MAG: methyltransferase domain-containing protein [Candidatus Eisenbacteria bacterium]
MAHWTDTFFTGFWSRVQGGAAMADAASREARVLRRVLGLRKGSRVADVPCGDGRISLELARAGCRVVGVDACEPSVRRARRRFREAGLAGTFRLGDMRDLALLREFNAVINWWGSFGYFDDDTNRQVLKGFADILVPGGRVLVDQVNRERVLRQFLSRQAFRANGIHIVTRNTWDPKRQRINGSWLFERGGERTRRRSSIRLYTPSEMKALMESAGLSVERICDGTTGSPFTRGSLRMSTVGRKL